MVFSGGHNRKTEFSYKVDQENYGLSDLCFFLNSLEWKSSWSFSSNQGYSTRMPFISLSFLICGGRFFNFVAVLLHLFHICSMLTTVYFCLIVDQDTPQVLQNIFRIYEEVSGQQINFQKSAMSFSPNIDEDYQDSWEFLLLLVMNVIWVYRLWQVGRRKLCSRWFMIGCGTKLMVGKKNCFHRLERKFS